MTNNYNTQTFAILVYLYIVCLLISTSVHSLPVIEYSFIEHNSTSSPQLLSQEGLSSSSSSELTRIRRGANSSTFAGLFGFGRSNKNGNGNGNGGPPYGTFTMFILGTVLVCLMLFCCRECYGDWNERYN